MLAKRTADNFFRKLENIEYGHIELVTPDGIKRSFSGRKPGPQAKLHLRDWSVVPNLILKGDVGFAEDYRSGLWDSDDLQSLLSFALSNGHAIEDYLHGNKLMQIGARISYLFKRNSKTGSRRNIHAHYDLGNEFYRLWLDETMTYSSAIYKNPNETLLQAQNNKYDRIIDQLGRNSGSVLEIGCGWGGFAERAAHRGDFGLKGITLSTEQHDFSVQRLGKKAHIALEDYRDQKGVFDHIISIEMFEAVGERYWPTYFGKVASLLQKGGRAVIQTITIDEAHFERYRKGGDMIRSFIFPGGMLPSPERFEAAAREKGLQTADRFFFGQDYATTLEQWMKNFDSARSSVLRLGFDEEFIRIWRLYLAACIAGFRTGRINVMQTDLCHA
ncbi:MAG: class I SAM-dependent methyltransferase [Proteobacteria bacterium]|nr:class I SAM-dependent methyltransferase [Pseudomonadota bacterium]